MTKHLISALPLFFTTLAFADVNVRDGDYSQVFQDLGTERTYHSRSLDVGSFGFGWCSDWDVTLDLKSDRTGLLSDCRNTNSTPVSVLNLGNYWQVKNQGATLFFTKNGLLMTIQKKNSEIHAVRDSRTQLILRLKSPRGETLQFEYANSNLTAKSSSAGFREKYTYDELHNLTEVSRWTQNRWLTTNQITYDIGRDLALTAATVNGCTDSFTYLRNTDLESATVVQRQCPHQSLLIWKYQFFYQTHRDGSISLNRMAVKSESGMTHLLFNPRTGENLRDGDLP